MQTLIQTTVLNPTRAVFAQVVNVLPLLLWAMVFLLVGALLARLLRKGVEKVLTVGQVDAWCDKAGINTVLAHLGLGRSPTKLVGVLAWWFVFLIFFMGAANVMSLTIVSEVLDRLAFFVPRVISAVFVLGAGVFVGTVVRDVVHKACTENKVKGASAISKLARASVVGFASFMALEQLGIAHTVTTSTLQIILGSIGLALALAFGLGGRDAAADILNTVRAKD